MTLTVDPPIAFTPTRLTEWRCHHVRADGYECRRLLALIDVACASTVEIRCPKCDTLRYWPEQL